MSASTVPAFSEVGVPCTGLGLALLVASMSWRVGTFRSVVLRRGWLVSLRLVRPFCDESTALRLVEFDVPTYFTRLAVTQHFPNGHKREWQVARHALHDELDVEDGVDALADSAHNGAQLFSNQSVSESSVSRKRPVEPRERVVQTIEFREGRLCETFEKHGVHHGLDSEARRGRRRIGLSNEQTDQSSSAILTLHAIAGTRGRRCDRAENRFHQLAINASQLFG
eukprot:623088-Pleurochrysis_carterae.AAC.1